MRTINLDYLNSQSSIMLAIFNIELAYNFPAFLVFLLISFIILKMPKKIILLNILNQYPFGKDERKQDPESFIQVQKTVSFDSQSRSALREKIRVLKNLGFQNLVAVQSTKSQENSITLFFQYVPFELLSEMVSLSEERKSRVYNGMVQLCNSLASRFIIHELDVKRVGLDKKYNLKYYLGIDFVIDRTISQNKIREGYMAQVNAFFAHTCKFMQQLKDSPQENINSQKYTSVPEYTNSFQSLESELQRNIKNLFQAQDSAPRKLLKKSSIIEEKHKEDEAKMKKASNRFTFNHTNRISLVILDKSQPSQIKESRVNKAKNLAARISHLKGYIKQIQGKIIQKCNTSSKHSQGRINEDNKTNNIFNYNQRQSNHYQKFSLKVQDSKQSQQEIHKKPEQVKKYIEKNTLTNTQPLLNHKQTLQKSRSPLIKESLYETVKYEPNKLSTPTVNLSKKNSINLSDNDRQHHQYLMLAQKDKYCQQFMMFLEDEGISNQKQNKSVSHIKPVTNEKNRLYEKKNSINYSKNNNIKEILKTQSSQNALEIQIRVNKVIRSSMKLINCLKSRDSLRLQ